ncbi:DUF29 domain-containing protein [Xanthobacteraceae bacterium Astr-EGSB]|uniref:DUF29 domain-containing protein n=1 Tax=Astrobacterium formosum TaxID=3069710 RepID=UPI0027AF4B98|nr:DUF29 domain-containing protein [Xanthobacteraceae bacterium Astr-EGSB]
MTGRSRDDISLAPKAAPTGAGYDRDVYTWSQEQARLIREGRWDEVDRHNVAEEIESVGRTEFSRLESALRIVLMHMLKWDHQPERRSRSWALSIAAQRVEIDDVLADNPGLKPRLTEAIVRADRRARLDTARETGLDTDMFATACPYGWDDVRARTFEV